MSDDSLLTELRQHLDIYFTKYPNISVNGLSKKIGVGEATLRRIVQGNLKKFPHPDNLIKILKYIYKEDDLSAIKFKVGGKISTYISEVFAIHDVIDPKEEELAKSLREYIQLPGYFLLILMAATHNGVSLLEVEQSLGENGLKALDTLKKAQYLKERDSRFFFEEKDFNLHISDYPIGLGELSKVIAPKANQGNYFQSIQSLNKDGIDKVNRIMTNALKEIYNVYSDKECHGDNHYIVTAFADYFPNDPNSVK